MLIINAIMKKYVNLSYKSLVNYARLSVHILRTACAKADEEGNEGYNLACIILSAINADGTVKDGEIQFICDILDTDEESAKALAELYTDDMPEKAKKFCTDLSGDLKTEVARLVLCIGAADLSFNTAEAILAFNLVGARINAQND